MRRLNTRVARAIVLAAVVALLALPATAFADELTGDSWWVTFTANDQMRETYKNGDEANGTRLISDAMAGMEPGDSITLTVNLKHENASSADWYMSNEVLDTLETATAQGSAYRYYLSYTGPGAPSGKVLYDSDRVGGDDTQGLRDATNNLDEYFYLDTLSTSQSTGVVTLRIALDGETEGNAYFNQDAVVKMKFAVEKTTTSTTPPAGSNRNVVVTGDDTNLLPFFIAMAVSGVLLAVLGVASVRARKRDRDSLMEGGAR